MIFLLLALVAGIAAGYAVGGRLRGLAALEPRILVLPWLALAIQLALGYVPDRAGSVPLRFALVLVSYATLGAWVWLVLRRHREAVAGASLIALGWTMNVLVITLNAGMPVSRAAVEGAGLPWEDVREGDLYKHVPAGDDTRLAFLGDMIPVPPVHRVVSAGDIVLWLGLVLFLAAIMRVGGRRAAAAPMLHGRRANEAGN